MPFYFPHFEQVEFQSNNLLNQISSSFFKPGRNFFGRYVVEFSGNSKPIHFSHIEPKVTNRWKILALRIIFFIPTCIGNALMTIACLLDKNLYQKDLAARKYCVYERINDLEIVYDPSYIEISPILNTPLLEHFLSDFLPRKASELKNLSFARVELEKFLTPSEINFLFRDLYAIYQADPENKKQEGLIAWVVAHNTFLSTGQSDIIDKLNELEPLFYQMAPLAYLKKYFLSHSNSNFRFLSSERQCEILRALTFDELKKMSDCGPCYLNEFLSDEALRLLKEKVQQEILNKRGVLSVDKQRWIFDHFDLAWVFHDEFQEILINLIENASKETICHLAYRLDLSNFNLIEFFCNKLNKNQILKLLSSPYSSGIGKPHGLVPIEVKIRLFSMIMQKDAFINELSNQELEMIRNIHLFVTFERYKEMKDVDLNAKSVKFSKQSYKQESDRDYFLMMVKIMLCHEHLFLNIYNHILSPKHQEFVKNNLIEFLKQDQQDLEINRTSNSREIHYLNLKTTLEEEQEELNRILEKHYHLLS